MRSTLSKTEIANMAAAEVGDGVITNIDTDTSPVAQKARLFWNQARDEILELHDWNSARARAELTQDTTAPENEYDYRYAVPADCIKVRRVIASESSFQEPTWEADQDFIVTNASAIEIVYTKREEVTTLYSPLLVKAIAINLAAYLAISVANDAKLQAQLLARRGLVIREAEKTDSRERNKDEDPYGGSEWEDVGRQGLSTTRSPIR
ncbi:MAG: hypothetical protein KAR06_01240 [Deltaproteobacteria bacterium]|nr:hypothetical protein [Deltaproteobacteria bacterium]